MYDLENGHIEPLTINTNTKTKPIGDFLKINFLLFEKAGKVSVIPQ